MILWTNDNKIMKVTNENVDSLIRSNFNEGNWKKLFILIRWCHYQDYTYDYTPFFSNLAHVKLFMTYLQYLPFHEKAIDRFIDNLIAMSTPEQWEVIRDDNEFVDDFHYVLRHGDPKYLLQRDYHVDNYYSTLDYASALHPIARELTKGEVILVDD
jgi:hypothetical protein